MRESVRAMLSDTLAPTAPLADFRETYEADDNVWWMVGSGHHMNLFDAACEEIDRLTGVLADCRKGITRWEDK